MIEDAMKTLLLVEDDLEIVELVALFLRNEGYNIIHVDDGNKVMDAVNKNHPDLIVMDIMLPNKDGYQCTKEIREYYNVPIIMLTARTEQSDKLDGLEYGADDYLCKPFDIQELLLRIKAVLRRANNGTHYQQWIVDDELLTVSFRSQDVAFTALEFKLFSLLFNSPNRVFSRAQIIDLAYADFRDVTDRAIDSHIKNVRRKLKQNNIDPAHIQSVYGAGYSFNKEPNAK
jgi:two-component system response regulator BaeR